MRNPTVPLDEAAPGSGEGDGAVTQAARLLRHREALGRLLDELDAPRLSSTELHAVAVELAGASGTGVARRWGSGGRPE